MKHVFVLSMLSICALAVNSQITVEPSSLPEFGDVLRYTTFVGYEDTVSYRQSGENLIWTLDEFNIAGSVDESYLDIEGTAIGDSFPEANMLVNLAIFEAAAIRSDTSIAVIGILPGDFSGFGVETMPVITEPYFVRKTPFSYGDSLADELSFRIKFSSDLIPGLDTIELPGLSLDSIRVTTTIMKSEKASAWGDLTILDQPYEVLQIKQVDQTAVQIEAGLSTILGGFIWLDATDFIGDIASAFNQQSTTYKFLSSDSKRSIVEFRETIIQDTILNVSGRIRADIISAASRPLPLDERLTIFPNPASDYLHIETKNETHARVELTILGLHGRVITQARSYGFGEKISVNYLPAGQYFVQFLVGDKAYAELISIIH